MGNGAIHCSSEVLERAFILFIWAYLGKLPNLYLSLLKDFRC
jgi:hypothetical protein